MIPGMVDWKLSAFSQPQEREIYRLTVKFYFASFIPNTRRCDSILICIIEVRLA
jgi:hypothetical protein